MYIRNIGTVTPAAQPAGEAGSFKMSTRRHAFASMGRRAAALAACMALVAGLAPYAPARADEAAPLAPAAQDTPAPA